MCNGKCGGGVCIFSKIAKILVVIGGVNWGLVGIGMFMDMNLNVVNILLGGMPTIEAVVYVLVGVSAVVSVVGCKCKACVAVCNNCNCGTETKTGESMM